MAANDSPISAELSKMIRDRRVAKRREGWETAGRVAGGIGDVITGGEVSRAKRAWTPFQDEPLTTRENIKVTQDVLNMQQAKAQAITALKQGNMKAARVALASAHEGEQKLLNLEYKERSAIAAKQIAADSEIEQLLTKVKVDIQSAQSGVPDSAAAAKMINKYEAQGFPVEGRLDFIEALAKDLLDMDALTASHVLDGLNPAIRLHISSPGAVYNDDHITQLQRKLHLAEMRAEALGVEGELVQADIDKVKGARAGRGPRLERAGGGGTSGGYDYGEESSQDTAGGSDGAGGADPELTQELLDYREFQPESRKDSEILNDQMLANPELVALAKDQGVDLTNSVQAAHFMKQLNKAQKLAERTYARSKRRGTDPRELLARKAKRARWWASLFGGGGAGTEDGQRSSRQMRIQLAQVLQGISPEHMDTYLVKHRKNKALEIDLGALEDSDTTEEISSTVGPTEKISLLERALKPLQGSPRNRSKFAIEADELGDGGEGPGLERGTAGHESRGLLGQGALDSTEISGLSGPRAEDDPYADPEMVYPEPESKSDSDFTQSLRASARESRALMSEAERKRLMATSSP